MVTEVSVRQNLGGGALAEFEEIYRSNVGVLAAYFARRCRGPQEVADLTSETIVRAAGSFASFDPHRGSARAWLFGIAAHVWAAYCAQAANSRDAAVRFSARSSTAYASEPWTVASTWPALTRSAPTRHRRSTAHHARKKAAQQAMPAATRQQHQPTARA